MACGCAKNRRPVVDSNTSNPVLGGFKYLSDRQIKARLEVYKKQNCRSCDKRYKCDYSSYYACKVKE